MYVAFEIGIHQGARLRETSVPFEDIDFERQSITFNAKGNNRFTTALHPDLAPILKKIKDRGLERTCILPDWPSKAFATLFQKIGMTKVCFHCTRVTVITRLARAGVPISQAMRFVGHASHTVHEIYQRLGVDDLSACLKALSPSQLHKS